MKTKGQKSKRSAYRKRRQYKRRGFRPVRSVPDRAQLTENTQLTTYSCNANQMYEKRDFNIAVNPRAAAVANAYQHYRIKKITMKFRPQVDTFVGGGAVGGYTAPYLYYIIDKSGSVPTNVSLAGLKSMGAKPFRLDENTFTVSWRPSVLTQTADGPGGQQPSQYHISPWLTTNRNALNPGLFVCSDLNHLGIFWYIETPSGPSTLQVNVEAILDVEYKKPMNSTNANDTDAIKA